MEDVKNWLIQSSVFLFIIVLLTVSLICNINDKNDLRNELNDMKDNNNDLYRCEMERDEWKELFYSVIEVEK